MRRKTRCLRSVQSGQVYRRRERAKTTEGRRSREKERRDRSTNDDRLLESGSIRLSSLVDVVNTEEVRVGELVVVDLVLCKDGDQAEEGGISPTPR